MLFASSFPLEFMGKSWPFADIMGRREITACNTQMRHAYIDAFDGKPDPESHTLPFDTVRTARVRQSRICPDELRAHDAQSDVVSVRTAERRYTVDMATRAALAILALFFAILAVSFVVAGYLIASLVVGAQAAWTAATWWVLRRNRRRRVGRTAGMT